jgi:hypothetical protein
MTKDEALDKKAENARELGLDYEPEQEPVVFNTLASLKHKKTVGPIERAMLNATPPQRTWIGLTNDEAQQTFAKHNCTISTHLAGILARAIEAKLKEKNT